MPVFSYEIQIPAYQNIFKALRVRSKPHIIRQFPLIRNSDCKIKLTRLKFRK